MSMNYIRTGTSPKESNYSNSRSRKQDLGGQTKLNPFFFILEKTKTVEVGRCMTIVFKLITFHTWRKIDKYLHHILCI